ncbi:MAG: hypothetical protein KKA07_03910 [Bacteroidetes bacterium]|nr:hypothetical protein [Bacteroidota bacterium]MBU1718199.1 hypothetical protein [Bacteroidota bacterium]
MSITILLSLARRLNLRARLLTQTEKETFGLGAAIDEGLSSGYVDESVIRKTLSGKHIFSTIC